VKDEVKVIVKNSLVFGGVNCSLVFEKIELDRSKL